MRLENKVAVITGAASGMGRAASLIFAEEGARVVAADINRSGGEETIELIHKNGGTGVFVPTDVTKEDQVEALVQRAVAEYGGLHVMYNNAGGSVAGPDDVLSTTEDEFYATVDLNLKGMYLGSKHALKVMIPAGGGSIVSTGSITGTRGQDHLGIYGAAKAGVINLTRYIAWAYGPQGVRANCVCPGAINTPALRKGTGDPGYPTVMAYFENQAPLHKVGEAEDIARAALFFASEESKHITGQFLSVDGGMTCGTFVDGPRLREMGEALLGA